MDAYTPAGLAALLAAGVVDLLPWIAVAVASALGLFFFYLAIRMSFRMWANFMVDRAYRIHGARWEAEDAAEELEHRRADREYGAWEVQEARWAAEAADLDAGEPEFDPDFESYAERYDALRKNQRGF